MEEDKLVKTIVNRFEADNDLIADGSSAYCLPTIKGKHSDLKSITPETVSLNLLMKFLFIHVRFKRF